MGTTHLASLSPCLGTNPPCQGLGVHGQGLISPRAVRAWPCGCSAHTEGKSSHKSKPFPPSYGMETRLQNPKAGGNEGSSPDGPTEPCKPETWRVQLVLAPASTLWVCELETSLMEVLRGVEAEANLQHNQGRCCQQWLVLRWVSLSTSPLSPHLPMKALVASHMVCAQPLHCHGSAPTCARTQGLEQGCSL